MLALHTKARYAAAALVAALPRGNALTEEQWRGRHRGITVLVWVHVVGLFLIAVVLGDGIVHASLEVGPIALLALGASLSQVGPRVRSALATLGLLVSSAVLVHLFGGLIEMHFHFFVTIAVVALYQAWGPYLLGLGFVVFHHGVIGMLAPDSIYNHHAAIADPALFAVVHGGFILAESIACLVYWKVNEEALAGERRTRAQLGEVLDDLSQAQRLAGLGSWDMDLSTGTVNWSDQFHLLVGTDPTTFQPTMLSVVEIVHPDDRAMVTDLVADAIETRSTLDYEFRLLRPDGVVRHVHALGDWGTDANGSAPRLFGTCQDVTERRRLQAEIEHLAFHDQLTGLPNRRLFLDRLEHALAVAARSERSCAVLFMDLDGFKVVNDTFGHAMGDQLLCEVGRRLSTASRAIDSVARFGGDEFAMLCADVDAAGAERIASRVREQLHRPLVLQGTRIVFRGSIGIAISERDLSAEDILREADAAMYAAKSSGKDSYRIFPPAVALT